jgi:hypothetical protein
VSDWASRKRMRDLEDALRDVLVYVNAWEQTPFHAPNARAKAYVAFDQKRKEAQLTLDSRD